MKSTYTIKDLLELFLGKIWLILLVTICGGILAFCFSKFALPLEYSSHISMYVQSYTDISENNADSQNNINNSKQLINTYIEVLKDDAVMRAVAEKLEDTYDEQTLMQEFSLDHGNIAPASLRNCINITSVTDTSALTVTTTTKNPEIAAEICNDLAAVAQDYIHEAVGIGSISTIDTAKVYDTPVAPNMSKNTLLGMAAGFVLILLIIIVIDYFDNTVKDTEELAKKYDKAIIGEVQQFGAEKKKSGNGIEEHIKLTDEKLPFYIVESYKSIRTNITFALSTFEKKILAVSSANPNEGKSTTSSNIAIAVAQIGNRVLLIDADMRKSVQHQIFGLKNKKGLSTAISKMSKVEDCIQKDVMENLDVMTAGPIPPNPSELLSSETTKKMLEELGQKYALIIIDLPPICVVSDAVTLSNDVAGLIMVVRYGKTTFEDVEEANKRVALAKMNMLGYVLNGIVHKHGSASYYQHGSASYYKYSYRSGYGYGYGYGTKPESKEDDAT